MANITAQETVNVISARIKKKTSQEYNSCEVTMPYSTTIVAGDELTYRDRNNKILFYGEVAEVKSLGSRNVTAYDFLWASSGENVNEVYYNTLIEDIIADLINKYTGMTYNSDFSSGVTVEKIVFKDRTLGDVIQQMLEIADAEYLINTSKEFVVYRRASETAGFTIDIRQNSANAILMGDGWEENTEDRAKRVIVVGDKQEYLNKEPKTLNAGEDTFNLAYKPTGSIRVINEDTGNVLTGEVEGSIQGDYTVDADQQEIKLKNAPGSQTNYTVEYNYLIDIRVERDTGQPNGRDRIFKKKYIKTMNEARKLARNLATFYEGNNLMSKLRIPDTANYQSIEPGYSISALDTTRNIDQEFTIQGIVYDLDRGLILELGRSPVDLFNYQKETIDRLKQLEESLESNQILQIYDPLQEKLDVEFKVWISAAMERGTGDAFYLVRSPVAGMEYSRTDNGKRYRRPANQPEFTGTQPSKFVMTLPFTLGDAKMN